MQATDTSAIQRLISQARFRIRSQWALEGATTASILAAAGALVAVFAMRMHWVSTGTGIGMFIASGSLIVIGAVISALRPIDDEMIARRIDRASNLSDRLSTAIAFQRSLATGAPAEGDAAETEDLMVAAIKDGVRAVPKANVAGATPFAEPHDLRAAMGFMLISAIVAGLMLPGVGPSSPHLVGVTPPVARPGDTVTIYGDHLLTGFVPTNSRVYLGEREIPTTAWTDLDITITIPEDAKPARTHLTVQLGARQLGPIAFQVVALDDERYHKEGAAQFDDEEIAYIEAIIAQLRELAKRDNVPELDEFAAKIEQLLKDAKDGKITKEQLLEALQKAEEALAAKAEPNQAEVAKAMAEMGKELAKENVTKDLGEALQKNDLAKAKEELEKLADKLDPEQAKKELEELKKQLEKEGLTPEQKQELQKKIDELKKQIEQAEEQQKKIDELKKQLEQAQTEQQKQELQKQLEEAKKQQLTEEQQKELQKQLEQLQKQMDKQQLTEQQKQELQKKLDQLKNQKPMSEQDKQKLQQKLEDVAKKMEQNEQKQQQQMQQQQQKLEQQIRELQKKKDEAKTEQEKLDAERQLQKKKDELQKLKKDQEDKDQSAQREALKRLHKDIEKAAENLEKKPQDQNKSKDERDEEEKERDRQASRNLKDAARETGRVDQDKRKQAAQKKMSSQMDDLREAMRRARQKGNKGPQDPFNKGNKNKDFQARARGQKGNGQSWKPGQGQQPGQGKQGQGQGNQPGGQGQQPGGSTWGTGTDPNLTSDPTAKSGNTKDEDLQGVHGKRGSSRRETILAAAQKGFASTSYQKVYADYERIVEEVMRTEKLPSSYKYYVKRYFAKIHPSTAPETVDTTSESKP